ncbi:MAG TPA: DNA alkylation repair protein [Thermoanaerobaculia bacterium]|jgi:3-methyladenine DNA glycosylase AlkD|nr:DNA alkylation repair protein [Thermoanaerobaculia bacterium]
MNLQETLDTLKSLGKEQTRKTYRRHGAGEDCYGVSSADLKSLQKKVKKDHDLARSLWATGNHEARILATMVADPQKLDGATLDAWAADLDNYIETGYLAALAAKSPVAREVMARWIDSNGEWIAAAGWSVLSHLAAEGGLSDAESAAALARIERDLHGSQNRVRHQMNGALISIGGSQPALQEKALAAARRIGKVEVDHGETGCKTPDAADYIGKMAGRRAAKAG